MGWAVLLIAVVLAVALASTVASLRRARVATARLDQALTSKQGRIDELEAAVAEAVASAAQEPPIDDLPSTLLEGGTDGSLTDADSGLYNEEFFRVTLEARVSAARRHLRPVAVVLLQVAEGVREGATELTHPVIVGACVKSTLRDADTACRLDDGRFALVLEDTPENGAVWTVERVRRALVVDHPGQTLWAGIACYPAHAFDAMELFERAGHALEAAREWHQDRIEVATSEV
jgi:two-component system cell cycle response regulator